MKKILLLLLISNFLFAQKKKYSNEFLNIGIGGKGQAMGGAMTANSNDVMSAYWNPANLTSLDAKDGLQVGAMHTEWFAGIGNYDYIALAIPMAEKHRTIGLSIIRFGIDNIPNTLSLYDDDGTINFDKVTNFSAADYAVLGSFAQGVNVKGNQLSLGGNVKIVRRVIGTFANSWGFGLDLGAQYQVKNFKFGLALKDITNTFNSWRFAFTDKEKQVLNLTNNTIPISSLEVTRPTINFGIAYQKKFNKVGLLAEADLITTTDGKRNTLVSGDKLSMNPAAGVEISYDDLVYVRGGISNFQKDNTFDKKGFWVSQPGLGVGLKIRNIKLDYAFTNVGSTENRSYSHIVSLILQVKPRVPKGKLQD
jgi:hypothetical protein